MKDIEFRCALSWFMCSDPWPLHPTDRDTIEHMLDEESLERGYDNWVHAYHDFKDNP